MQVQSHFFWAVCKRLMRAMVFFPAIAQAQTTPNIVVTFTSVLVPTSVTPVPLSRVAILAVFAIAVTVLWLRRRSMTQFPSIFVLTLAIGVGSLGLSYINAVNANNAQRVIALNTSPTVAAVQDKQNEILQLRNDTQAGIRLQSILLENNSSDEYRLGRAEDEPTLTQRCTIEQTLVANDFCVLQIIFTEQSPIEPIEPGPPGIVVFDFNRPVIAPADAQHLVVGQGWQLTVNAIHAQDSQAGSVALVRSANTPTALQASGAGPISLAWQPTAAEVGEHLLSFHIIDASGKVFTQSMLLSVTNPSDVPPPASSLAPEMELGTSFADSSNFLYTGANPIQKGMQPNLIEQERAIVLRGKVTDRAGAAMAGVTVKLLNKPEFGSTQTQQDGWFDLAANGGDLMVLEYSKPGYLRVQRKVDTVWRDYAIADQVAMTALDAKASPIELGREQWQLGRGSPTNDERGVRVATLLFPPNTTAQLQFDDGTEQALSHLTFRATEYTVGDIGPNAMPGELPISVGYTYAAELSADEAIAAGARSVQFNQPIPFYVENFLDFPVGTIVPSGWYDYDRAAWIGSDNGRVIKILSINNGLANLQVVEESGVATQAQLQELGIEDAERAALAQLYPSGTSLWRAPVSHFTPWDLNVPYGPPEDADEPPDPDKDPNTEDCENGQYCCPQPGCDIYPNQKLGQVIRIPGSPFNLYYDSSKAGQRTYAVPLLKKDQAVPASLQQIRVQVDIAGRRIERIELGTSPRAFEKGMTWDFEWDGRDAYGRIVLLGAEATFAVSHRYPLRLYASASGALSAFSALSVRSTGSGGSAISRNSANTEMSIDKRWKAFINTETPDVLVSGAGGWALSGLQFYDAAKKRLYMGGSQTETVALTTESFQAVATLDSTIGWDPQITPTPEGEFVIYRRYQSFNANADIWRVDRAGNMVKIAGSTAGYSGDGGPALSAQFREIRHIERGVDGSLYVADQNGLALRRILPNGIVIAVAGDGTSGGPRFNRPGDALNATIEIRNFGLDRDGSVFYSAGNYMMQIAAHGELSRVAGTNIPNVNYANFRSDPLGGLWAITNQRIYSISPGGEMRLVAGGGQFIGDGSGLNLNLYIDSSKSLVADRQGGLFFYDFNVRGMRHLDSSGYVSTVDQNGVSFALTPDGEMWQLEGRYLKKRVGKLPDFTGLNTVIPLTNGIHANTFDQLGKQIATIVEISGKKVWQLYYSGAYLLRAEDADGNSITIVRDDQNRISSITGINGEVSRLAYNGRGMLASVASPGDIEHYLSYLPDVGQTHLLSAYKDPAGEIDRFVWKDKRLIENISPSDGGWAITTAQSMANNIAYTTTTLTSAEGRSYRYKKPTKNNIRGEQEVIFPDGEIRTSYANTPYGSTSGSTTRNSDGTVRATVNTRAYSNFYQKDGSRNRESSSRESLSFRSYFGTTNTNSWSTISPFSGVVTGGADINSLKSRFSLDRYGLLTQIDHLGRRTSANLDDVLRPEYIMPIEGAATIISRDQRGRTIEIESLGNAAAQNQDAIEQNRQIQLAYHDNAPGKGLLASTTNALGQTSRFTYDAAGNIQTSTLPGGLTTVYGYDLMGNLISLQTPAGVTHRFSYDSANQPIKYDAPASAIQWQYNRDGDLMQINRPGGQSVLLLYDSAGRLSKIEADAVPVVINYGSNSRLQSLNQGSNRLIWQYTDIIPTGNRWEGDIKASLAYILDPIWRSPTQIAIQAGFQRQDLPVRISPLGELGQIGNLKLGWGDSGRLLSASINQYGALNNYNSFLEIVQSRHTAPARIFLPENDALLSELKIQYALLRTEISNVFLERDDCRTQGWWDDTDGIRWRPDTLDIDDELRELYTEWYGPLVPKDPDLCIESLRRHLEINDFTFSASEIHVAWIPSVVSDLKTFEALLRGGAYSLAHSQVWPGQEINSPLPKDSYLTAQSQSLFDEVYRLLTAMESLVSNVGFAAQWDYRRDMLGRIVAQREVLVRAATDHQYEYDEAGRLTLHTQGSGAQVLTTSWSYDRNGNRTHENGIEIASYDSEDRLQSWQGNRYQYNPAGDLTSKTNRNGTTSYTYDSMGNLRAVVLADGTSIEYLIDPLNRRIGKKTNGSLQFGLIYQDELRPIADIKPNGDLNTVYLYGEKGNVPSAMLREGKTYRIISDHLGSVRLVIDTQTGEVMQQMDYDVWGLVLQDSNPGFQPFGFAGGLYDFDTGLTRFGARDYDAETGRWTAKDSILFDGGDANLYGYVLQDPVNSIDLNGKQTCVLVTRGFMGFGNHSALYMGRGSDNGGSVIYDPAGSFARSVDPFSGDLIDGATINDFESFHKKNFGDSTDVVCKNTSKKQEREYYERAVDAGPGYGMQCAEKVSTVIGGSVMFPRVRLGTFFPGNLFRDAK